jgi:biotin operon repressor
VKGTLILNQKEQKRVMVLNQIETNKLSLEKGATLLGLSERQVWRLLAGYRKEGVEALAHGNRGRQPINTIKDSIRLKVIELAKFPYAGLNHQHLTEKLNEKEGISVCRSSVRNILLEAGLSSPRKRRPPKHRSRRERYPREGMLLQTDGSPHDWLEGRGPKLCLIGAIDDATSKVPYAFFQEQEDTQGYMRLLREIVAKRGIPLALYHDKHSIFDMAEDKLPTLEEQLKGKKPLTQMGRLLEELGIESISANSPQAKGRIERLWGTFQDRLVSELRLAGAKTKEDANLVLKAWLPDYNRRFAIPARETGLAYRKVGKGFQAEEYFCFKYTRTIGADNVVRFGEIRLQVLPTADRSSYARCEVEVQQRLDGNVAIYYQGQHLPARPAPLEPTALRKPKLRDGVATPSLSAKRYAKPAPDHPWRTGFDARRQLQKNDS